VNDPFKDETVKRAERALDEQVRLDGRSEVVARAQARLDRDADEALYNIEVAQAAASRQLLFDLLREHRIRADALEREAPEAGRWYELEDGAGWWSIDPASGERLELR
jgi:hypothetical protein